MASPEVNEITSNENQLENVIIENEENIQPGSNTPPVPPTPPPNSTIEEAKSPPAFLQESLNSIKNTIIEEEKTENVAKRKSRFSESYMSCEEETEEQDDLQTATMVLNAPAKRRKPTNTQIAEEGDSTDHESESENDGIAGHLDAARISVRRRSSSAHNLMWAPHVVWQGNGLKKGFYSGTWRKRFYKLMKSNEVLYYENSQDLEPRGTLHIGRGTQFEKEDLFGIFFVARDKTWHLRYYTEEERDMWFDKFEEIRDKIPIVQNTSAGSLLHADYVSNFSWVQWRTRFIKLYKDGTVKVLDDRDDSIEKSSFVLKKGDIEDVPRTNTEEKQWPYEFHVTTDDGTFKFRTRTSDQMEKWFREIKNMWTNNIYFGLQEHAI